MTDNVNGKWAVAIKKQEQALREMEQLYRNADQQLKEISRSRDMSDEEKDVRRREQYRLLKDGLRQSSQMLTAAQKEAMKVVEDSENLSTDTITRRLYYRQLAEDELNGADSGLALEIARQAAVSGDTDKALMYLSAARPLAKGADQTELSRLHLQAEPMASRRARHLSTVNRQLAERIEVSRDLHETRMEESLGQVDSEDKAGLQDDPALDTRGLYLLANNLEIIAADLLVSVVKAESCDSQPTPDQVSLRTGDEVSAGR